MLLTKTNRTICTVASATLGLFLIPFTALAVEVFLTPAKAAAGKPVTVALMADKIDNLAGIKVVLTYDDALLGFEKAVKTEKSAGLMHVVNDTKPGLLIVVMAGARGVKINNEPILNLHFMVKPEAAKASSARLRLTEAQLMSDQLKDIKCTLRSHDIAVEAVEKMRPGTSGN